MCILIFSIILSENFLILRRIERDMTKNVFWDCCKLPVIFVRFYWNLNFVSTGFLKKTQIPNFIKICPVRTELFHADGRTDKHDEHNDDNILITRGRTYQCDTSPRFTLR